MVEYLPQSLVTGVLVTLTLAILVTGMAMRENAALVFIMGFGETDLVTILWATTK